MILTKDKGMRMWGGGFGKGSGGTGGSGGSGGQMPDLSGYATTDWVRSLTWWGQSLPQDDTDIVGALTGVTSITMTGAITGATGLTLNSGAISGVTTLTASGRATVESLRIGDGVLKWDAQNNAFYVEKADGSVASFYAMGSVSALGFSASGGGGGGATELDDLSDVALSTPQTGQVLMYDGTTGKWYNGTVQGGGGGTVTSVAMSVPTGFAVSGTPITSSGTLALTFASGYSLPTTAKQTNWDTAYGWGDHAQAGYATQTWVGQQGFITSSAISDMATKTWVGQQGFLTSSSNIAFSQLPTMYWANVAISSQSNTNTTPQFGSVRIRPDSAYYGGYLRFGDGDYAFIAEQVDDKLTYKAGWHNFTTGEVNAAVGLRIGGAVSGTALSGGCLIEWDSTKNAVKVNGNIYATGFVSALGAGSGVGTVQLETLTLTGDGTGKALYITDGDIELESGRVYAESGFRTIGSYGFGTTTDVAEISYNSSVGFVFTGGPISISGQNNSAGIYMNGSRLYFDSSRYIYGSNGHLYFYNGSTTITLA